MKLTLNGLRVRLPRQLFFFYVLMMAPLGAMAAPEAQLEVAPAMRLKPNIEHGALLFQTCSKCHGLDGGGSRVAGTPDIAGQHFRVLVKQLMDYQHDRRWDFRMEQIAKQHDLKGTQAVVDVAKFASELDWKTAGGIGDGELVDHGQEVYLHQCQSCHGASAQGDSERLIPRLAGQHYGYLLREMHDAVEGRRPNFSLKHIRFLQKLDRDDFVGLADFLSRRESARKT